MEIRFAREDEVAIWNDLVISNPDQGNVFQGKEFADHKATSGWTPRFIRTSELAITILEKRLPLLGKLWYIPKGPGITDTESLAQLIPHLRRFAQKHGVFLIKIEPELLKTDMTLGKLRSLSLSPARQIQPNISTVLIDTSPDLDTILSNLNQKGRHALRRAERDGITVTPVPTTDENCRVMYDLLRATSAGKFEASVRDYEYYASFWQRYEATGNGKLFFAHLNGELVAAAFTIILGHKATYKDGASVRERPAYGASHLLQWRIVEWLKTKNVTSYDLCGTPPSDQINNPQHSYYGIGRFKTSFNKQVTDYVGVYDLPISPLTYFAWQHFGERAVNRLHQQQYHNRFFY